MGQILYMPNSNMEDDGILPVLSYTRKMPDGTMAGIIAQRDPGVVDIILENGKTMYSMSFKEFIKGNLVKAPSDMRKRAKCKIIKFPGSNCHNARGN